MYVDLLAECTLAYIYFTEHINNNRRFLHLYCTPVAKENNNTSYRNFPLFLLWILFLRLSILQIMIDSGVEMQKNYIYWIKSISIEFYGTPRERVLNKITIYMLIRWARNTHRENSWLVSLKHFESEFVRKLLFVICHRVTIWKDAILFRMYIPAPFAHKLLLTKIIK